MMRYELRSEELYEGRLSQWLDIATFAVAKTKPRIWAPSPKVEVLTYSDASGLGWGGFAIHINGEPAVGSWSEEESDMSFTFRELRAIRLVLESYGEDLRGKVVSQN